MILKKYSELFEADVKDNKGVPSDYIEGVEQKGREQFGYNGPNPMEMREMMETMHSIMRIQDGNEEKLTEIGKAIIEEYYGSILDDVKLDIKIVKPNDPEKREMVEKMFDEEEQEEEQEEQEPGIESPEIEVPDVFPVDVDEVDKRKILNNLMQGEAQNVHSMMHTKKDEIDEVDDFLLDLYTRLLEINRKFDWMDRADLEEMMKQNPDMANAEEVEWEEDEDGEQTPVIKVRCLDLPMLIHETVKGIYELIMANAIPENAEMARKVIEETDSLKNEKEDIKFGPFIAADIRDFFTDYIDRKTNVSLVDIPNLREFIYGYMVELEASKFLELTYAILSDDKDMADDLIKKYDIVEPAIADATGELEEIESSYDEDEEVSTMNIDDIIGGPKSSDEPLTPPKEEEPKDRSKKLASMGKNQLNFELNKAIDNEDWEYAKEIQAMMQRKGLMD
jgi:hypothetical protein